MKTQLGGEFFTAGGVFSTVVVVGTAFAAIGQAWGSIFMWDGAPKFNWLFIVAFLCAVIFLIWKSHKAIIERNRITIAALEGRKGTLRFEMEKQLDDHSNGYRYLRGILTNDGEAVEGVQAKRINIPRTFSGGVDLPDTLILKWSADEVSDPLDIPSGDVAIFDIGQIKKHYESAILQLYGRTGTKDRYAAMGAGDHSIDLRITGKGIDPITRRLKIRVVAGDANNVEIVEFGPLT